MQSKNCVGARPINACAARPRRIKPSLYRRVLHIIYKQTAGLFLDLQPADIAVLEMPTLTKPHPFGRKAVFRAMDRHKCPLSVRLNQTIAAAVRLVRQQDQSCKRELRKLCRGKAAKHALFSDWCNERDRCSCPSEDIGDIISASANGKTLAVRMQVFLCSRQMIDTDNDVYAG